MGDHEAPKIDSGNKLMLVLSAVVLLVTVGYLVLSLTNTIQKNTLPTEVAEAPQAPAEPEAVAEAEETPAETAKAEPEKAAASGPSASQGAEMFAANCASCHGAEGQGQGMFPKVTGLGHDEIVSKLKAYRAGEQVGPQTAMMAPNAQGLSDEDIESLALHLAGGEAKAATADSEPAAGSSAGGDAQAGASMYASNCASCHGAEGQGQGMFPKVAGLGHDEIVSKLEAYRAGEQVGPQTAMMAPNAKGLSDADIQNLAAHLSGGQGGGEQAAADTGDGAETASAPAGDVTAGKDQFAAQCASCHGMQAQGQGMFPGLTGLSAGDAADKLKAYRAGEQVGPQTAMMAPNAANLSDEEIANLAAYIGSL
mgnify:CR=1 FL=1